jgi:type IV secretion system protein VirB1
MKSLLGVCLLVLTPVLHAQTADLDALQSRCLPAAPKSTLGAIVQVESGGNPNAMQIDFPKALLKQWKLHGGTLRLKRQPTNQQEALEWLAYFQRSHVFVDLGLMQVSTAEAKRRGISPMSLLDPCTNLRVGWQILEDAYKVEVASYGPGQTALEHAISIYNTGNSQQGIDNGYLGRVFAAARRLGIDANPRGLAR